MSISHKSWLRHDHENCITEKRESDKTTTLSTRWLLDTGDDRWQG
ncbi:hypothetical protein M2146_002687 [Lachnospiraceae bacterium PF1-22]